MYFLRMGVGLHLMRDRKACVCCVCMYFVLDILIGSLQVASKWPRVYQGCFTRNRTRNQETKKPPRHRSATPPGKPRRGSPETTLSELQFWAWGPIFSRSREHRTLLRWDLTAK